MKSYIKSNDHNRVNAILKLKGNPRIVLFARLVLDLL